MYAAKQDEPTWTPPTRGHGDPTLSIDPDQNVIIPGPHIVPDARGWREVGRRDNRSDALKLLRWMYRGERGHIARGEPVTQYRIRHLGRGNGYAIEGLFGR